MKHCIEVFFFVCMYIIAHEKCSSYSCYEIGSLHHLQLLHHAEQHIPLSVRL